MRITLLLISFFLLSATQSFAQNPASLEKEICKIEKVYPNPANSHVYVEISLKEFSIVRFQLVNILGNKVQEWKAQELFSGTHKVKLQFKSLQSGIYLLKIRAGDSYFVKRIRKN